MTDATLARGGTTVTLPLRDEGGGAPVVARDIGKPELDIKETGAINPRFVDVSSVQVAYTLRGVFRGSSAYSDAISVCDLFKEGSNGNAITLNIGMAEFDTDMSVAPAPRDGACTVAYAPGERDTVVVDLQVVRINSELAAVDQTASTPTASGTGPITLSDGTTTHTFDTAETIERAVGRPKSTLQHVPHAVATYPNHRDKFKTATDRFDIALSVPGSVSSTIGDLESVFTSSLARTAMTLDFQGIYGLGSFSVVPDGSSAVRHVRATGVEGTAEVPAISLRRVA